MVLPTQKLAEKEIKAAYPAFIMGILNVTGNSFWDGSNAVYRDVDMAVATALKMIEDGADIIDIGGESTKPGSEYVSAEEELSRVIPVLKKLRQKTDVPVSIDTRKAAVMKAALDEGADILNDVSALEDDAGMAGLVAASKIPVVLMHKRGIPSDMQKNTAYDDITAEVASYLAERAVYAWKAGIEADKIILDYGAGFGKDVQGNIDLVRHGGEIARAVQERLNAEGAACKALNVLAGLSRKSFIGHITGRDTADRLYGTIAADLFAVQHGATIIRVHDVAAARDSLAVYRSVL